MGRTARHLSALILCGTCALGALAAIAIASPARQAPRSHATKRARSCTARAHRHGRPARRSSRCTAAKRPSTRSRPAAGTPSAAAPGSTASPPPGGSPTTAGAPPTGSAPESSEATGPTPPPSIPHVQVTAVEYHYTLSRTVVPAGKVILQFVNNGEDEHNLNLIPGEGPAAGSFADLPSKGIRSQEIELRPGAYTLFCSLPEHESRGMKATLFVQ
jgi:hypothetical protein